MPLRASLQLTEYLYIESNVYESTSSYDNVPDIFRGPLVRQGSGDGGSFRCSYLILFASSPPAMSSERFCWTTREIEGRGTLECLFNNGCGGSDCYSRKRATSSSCSPVMAMSPSRQGSASTLHSIAMRNIIGRLHWRSEHRSLVFMEEHSGRSFIGIALIDSMTIYGEARLSGE